jgi:hypothetical protein
MTSEQIAVACILGKGAPLSSTNQTLSVLAPQSRLAQRSESQPNRGYNDGGLPWFFSVIADEFEQILFITLHFMMDSFFPTQLNFKFAVHLMQCEYMA